MNAFFRDGHAVDLILVVMALECAFLLWRKAPEARRTGAVDLFFAFAPGVCLLLALRAALTDAGWMWTGLWLAASFPVHVGDLLRRRL